jgi:hypothetical protein
MCINSKGSNNPNRSKKKQLYFQKQLYSIYKVHENYNLGAYLYREPNLLKNRFINLEQRYYINIEKKSLFKSWKWIFKTDIFLLTQNLFAQKPYI